MGLSYPHDIKVHYLSNFTASIAGPVGPWQKKTGAKGNGAEDVERSHWEPLLSSVAGMVQGVQGEAVTHV